MTTAQPNIDEIINLVDTRTILEFREYLDKMASHFNTKIEKAKEEKDENGDMRVSAYITSRDCHDQLRDIKTVREILESFALYVE